MSDILKIAGVLLVAVVAELLFKEKSRTAALGIAGVAFVTVVLYLARGQGAQAVSLIESLTEDAAVSEMGKTLVKALGISYVAGITAEICEGAGETSLASAASFAGKAEIIILCIPNINALLEIARGAL